MKTYGYRPIEPTPQQPFPSCRAFFTPEEAWSYFARALHYRHEIVPIGAPGVPVLGAPELGFMQSNIFYPTTIVQEFGPPVPATTPVSEHVSTLATVLIYVVLTPSLG